MKATITKDTYTVNGKIGRIEDLTGNPKDFTFNYNDKDGRPHKIPFDKTMVGESTYLRIMIELVQDVPDNTHDDNESEIDNITNMLNGISENIKVNVDKIHELEGSEIAEAMYELVEDEKEDIAEFLGIVQITAENVGVIAKQAKKFVKEMDEDNKQVFVDIVNTPEFTPYKDLIADSHYRVAVILGNVGKLLKTKEEEFNSAESWHKSIAKKWNSVKLFGVNRSIKVKLALRNLNKLFN